MLCRLAWRFYDAMDQELRAWVIYEIGWGHKRYTVTDECRVKLGPAITDKNFWKPLQEIQVVQMRFDKREEAERFIQIECIKRGLVHLLCFWRKDPKLWP